MRRELLGYIDTGGDDLHPAVKEAIVSHRSVLA
jgi:hypothetical protein